MGNDIIDYDPDSDMQWCPEDWPLAPPESWQAHKSFAYAVFLGGYPLLARFRGDFPPYSERLQHGQECTSGLPAQI